MKTSNKLLLGFLIVILVAISAFLATARLNIDKNTIAGNGNKKTKTVVINEFDKINIHGKFKLHLIQGASNKLEIRASENLIPLVEYLVKDGELQIHLKNRISNHDRIELFLTAKAISSLETYDGIEVLSEGTLTGDNLILKGMAGADVNLNLNYQSINVESHAGAKLDLSGKATEATIIATSGATISAYNLEIEKCKAQGSAGGSAEVNVTGELDVSANSGGSVRYSGNPTIKNIDTNSGGVVNRR